MGYQMPIVCKEIHLPCGISSNEFISFAKYKEITGIDLNELVELDESNLLTIKPLCKIYVVSESYGSGIAKVALANRFEIQDGEVTYGAIIAMSFDGNYGFGLTIDVAGKRVKGFVN